VLFGGSLLTGCYMDRGKKADDVKETGNQANQDLKDAQNKFEKEWQEFKSDAELKISANETRIDEIKVEIKTSSGEFKANYEKEVGLLEQENADLKEKISEYKYESKDKWEGFKQGFNHDMDVVRKKLADLFSKKN
jgi:uncharacterized protein involved in exopolysaccharide biosynthesis